MSRWLPERLRGPAALRVAIDARGFACTMGGEVRTGGHDELPATLAPIKPGCVVEIAACNDVAVNWLQQVPRSLASLAELRQAAAARCAQLFGGKAAEWNVEGDWRTDGEFICAGIPRAFVARIEESLKPLSLRVRWRAPLLVMAEAPTGGWTGMRCASTLALWHATAGRIDSMTLLRVDAKQADEEVFAAAKRHAVLEQARRGVADSSDIRWLEPANAGGSEAVATLAFLATSRAPSRRAPAAAAAASIAGLVALIAIGMQVRQDAKALADAQAELSRLRAAPVTVSMPQKTAAAAAQQRRAVDQVTRQLNTPWSQLLDALEASLPDDVALVSIEPDGAGGKVRLQSEAKKLDSLITYAAELRKVPMFAQVALLKHETNDQDANRPMRMTMEVELASRVEGSSKR